MSDPTPQGPTQSAETLAAHAAREAHLRRVGRIVTAVLAFGTGPIVLAQYLAEAWLSPVWQLRLLASTAVLMWTAWAVAYRLARGGRFERAGLLVHFSVLFQCSLLLALREGAFAVGALSLVGTSMLIWVLAPRWLVPSGALTVVALVALRIAAGLHLLPQAAPPPVAAVVLDAFICGSIIPIVLGCLKMAANLNEVPFRHLERSAGTRLRILANIGQVQPELATMAERVSRTANVVAAGAHQQAQTAEQVAHATRALERLLVDASAALVEARTTADATRRNAAASQERLDEVERELAGFLDTLRGIVTSVQGFAERSTSTEGVIGAVEEVHETVKILAINAAIEAARAGEAGRGTAVVASEMRSLIAGTESSVREGRHLLAAVKTEAGATVARASAAAAQLERHLAALRNAREIIGDVLHSFGETARTIETIADAGEQQRRQVEVVSKAMQELHGSAGDLTRSAADLLGGTDAFVRTQADLARLVDDREAAASLASGA